MGETEMIHDLKAICSLYMEGFITGNEARDRLLLVLNNYRDNGKNAREMDTLCELILKEKVK